MKRLLVILSVAFAAVIAHAAAAPLDKCSLCGCKEQIRKVCKAVPDTKKVKATVWSCKCEEICIPGRTKTHDCTPTCGRVRGVRKLVKKEVTKEVPSYKWVTTYVCVNCCGGKVEVPPPAAAK